LGLIHRCGIREAFELDEKVEQRECNDQGREHRDANDRNESALVDGVDDVLDAFSGVRHGGRD
jgi:hypothetical protein